MRGNLWWRLCPAAKTAPNNLQKLNAICKETRSGRRCLKAAGAHHTIRLNDASTGSQNTAQQGIRIRASIQCSTVNSSGAILSRSLESSASNFLTSSTGSSAPIARHARIRPRQLSRVNGISSRYTKNAVTANSWPIHLGQGETTPLIFAPVQSGLNLRINSSVRFATWSNLGSQPI